ncbi:MAG: pilus assembly protein [Lachnospiraceae bacterium]|nr:pilus assembly protein [Lachnospiraceae bacterium]
MQKNEPYHKIHNSYFYLNNIFKKPGKPVLKGSLTIEASFIIPLIFIIFTFIILFSFYLHDKIVVNSASYRALIYASYDLKDFNSSDYTDNHNIHKIVNSFPIAYYSNKPEISEEEDSLSIIIDFQGASTIHCFSHFMHCDDIRKYSIIFKKIKEIL